MLSWEKVNNLYGKTIQFFMNWKKSFLIIFIIAVPLITIISMKTSKFQLFPKFDATDIKISLKTDSNSSLENSFRIVQEIEKELILKKDDFFIRSIDSVAGFRRDLGNNSENFPYVMYMTVELQKLKAANLLDKYITPYLSFYYDKKDRVRTEKSKQIAKKLNKFLKDKNFKEKYNLQELVILEKKVGPVKADIKIGLVSYDTQKIIKAIDNLQEKLEDINGIKSISNSLKFGNDEIKIKVNSYGQSLGLTETSIGTYLSNLYSLRNKSTAIDEKELLDIKIQSKNKDDFESFKNTQIPLNDGSYINLSEVVEFKILKALEQLLKDDGQKNFYVFANVDPDIITSSEVIQSIQATLDKIQKNDIKLIFKGEAQRKKELQQDMFYATILALILIMISMLYLFNSFKETFIVMSIIPFSILGVLIGHKIMGLNLSMPSMIGALGLAGVVINDGIIMMTYLKKAKNLEEIFIRATKRFRPIIITTITTLIGLSPLIFFPTGQAVIFQPIAIAIGFGLAWGTVLNLIYMPVLYTLLKKNLRTNP